MSNNENLEYRIACTEVLECLKFLPKTKVEKIPKNVLVSMQRMKRYDYRFRFDKTKSIKEQNISNAAKKMLNNFYRDYWANDSIRMMMLAKERFDQKKQVV